MSTIHVGGDTISPEKITAVMAIVFHLLEGLAKATKNTDVDDRVVAFLSNFVNEPWFAELLASMINTFGDKPITQEDVLAHYTQFMAAKVGA